METKEHVIDKRLTKRYQQMTDLMLKKNTSVINRLSSNRADLVGLCRFVNNERVTMDYLKAQEISRVKDLSKNKHVLVIQDTTDFNYNDHINFLSMEDEDLGPAGNDEVIGFFLHTGLVVDTANGLGLGFSYINVWNRQWDKTGKQNRKYKQQPIESKESYRWIDCGLKSKSILSSVKAITIVADREGDIYDEFVSVPDQRTNILIRSCQNRCLAEGDTLYERIENTNADSIFKLKVRTTKNRKGRDTVLEIKYTKVKISKPLAHKSETAHVEMYAVEAKEKSNKVPKGEKPIHWVLITTHRVKTTSDALQIINWYSMRWQIELLFYTLKTAALDIESSELETGKALKKLTILALGVSLKINQLRQTRSDTTGIPAKIIFTKEQIALIKLLIPKYEGNTQKQKNPYKENTLAWAGWLIARLGGWKGYERESPPGNKTFKWGLDRYDAMYEGYMLTKNLCA